jgi:hypothetical protein
MDITVLNKSLVAVGVLDTYESCIWTERYDSAGDFEIRIPVSAANIAFLQEGYYLTRADSEKVMIINTIQILTDTRNGNTLVVSGLSLESVLSYRIVWKETVLNGNLQTEVIRLLTENAINPTITARKMTKLVTLLSTNPTVTSLTVKTELMGMNLYEFMCDLASSSSLGFKVKLLADNTFEFSLYAGTDRSYAQIIRPYVVFSPSFENIINSNYFVSTGNMRTVTLVTGEGEGSARLRTIVDSPIGGAKTELDRREIYTDARQISKTVDGSIIPDPDYLLLLTQFGLENLSDHIGVVTFDGEVEATKTFVFGRDFFMGDIIQIANEYGMVSSARVTELIRSDGRSGIEVYPTFTMIL